MSRERSTTVQAAAIAGVPRGTLQHWIKAGRITAPDVRLVGGRAARMWTKAQMERIRRMKGTLKLGRKKALTKKVR